MNRRFINIFLILLSVAISMERASAADEITVRKSKAPVNIVRGDVDPSSVPLFLRYESFFSFYSMHRDSIIQQIGRTDDEILSVAANNKMNWELVEQSRREAAWQVVCANRHRQTTNELAREIDALDQAGYKRREEHWGSELKKLSVSGRKVVRAYIDYEVARGISAEIPSVVALEQFELETFTNFVEDECYKISTGDYPEDVKRSNEEFSRFIEEKGLDALADVEKENDN